MTMLGKEKLGVLRNLRNRYALMGALIFGALTGAGCAEDNNDNPGGVESNAPVNVIDAESIDPLEHPGEVVGQEEENLVVPIAPAFAPTTTATAPETQNEVTTPPEAEEEKPTPEEVATKAVVEAIETRTPDETEAPIIEVTSFHPIDESTSIIVTPEAMYIVSLNADGITTRDVQTIEGATTYITNEDGSLTFSNKDGVEVGKRLSDGEIEYYEDAAEVIAEYLAGKEAEWVEMGFAPDDGLFHNRTMEINGVNTEVVVRRFGTTQIAVAKSYVDSEIRFSWDMGGTKMAGDLPMLNPEYPGDAEAVMDMTGYLPAAIQITELAIEKYGKELAKEKGLIFYRRDQQEYDETWFDRYIKFLNSDHELNTHYELKGSVPHPNGGSVLDTLGFVDPGLPFTMLILPPTIEKDGASPEDAPYGLTIMETTSGFFGVTVDDGAVTVFNSDFLINGLLMGSGDGVIYYILAGSSVIAAGPPSLRAPMIGGPNLGPGVGTFRRKFYQDEQYPIILRPPEQPPE